MHANAHHAPRELVHHHEHPMAPQDRRLAAKQVETPETVLRVTERGEPGRPSRVWLWAVVVRQYSNRCLNHIASTVELGKCRLWRDIHDSIATELSLLLGARVD